MWENDIQIFRNKNSKKDIKGKVRGSKPKLNKTHFLLESNQREKDKEREIEAFI